MKKKVVNKPVAVIVYNRPEHTARLVAELERYTLSDLVFIADGPKTELDYENCEKVRSLVTRDWACNVDYVFSDRNLGCKNRVTSGLDRVFEKHESAIILEDDCIPADTFFDYCELVLNKFQEDDRILMACGTVLVEDENNPDSYFFSSLPHIWGWATWRDRWHKYTSAVSGFNLLYEKNLLTKSYPEPFVRDLKDKLERIQDGSFDTWDVQMTYLAIGQNLLSVFPNKNLITNIGFGEGATHTKSKSILGELKTGSFNLNNVKHPEFMLPSRAKDLERMLIEGQTDSQLKRFFKIIFKKNGMSQILAKIRMQWCSNER